MNFLWQDKKRETIFFKYMLLFDRSDRMGKFPDSKRANQKYSLMYSILSSVICEKTDSQTCPCNHLYLAVTCIEMSPFSCPIIEYFIWIEPLLRSHLS